MSPPIKYERYAKLETPTHRGVCETQLLTSKQLAQRLGISLRKLERDRQNGTGIPFVKLGHRVLYRQADVEAHLVAKLFRSTAEAKRAEENR